MKSVIDHRRDNLLLEINTSGFNIFLEHLNFPFKIVIQTEIVRIFKVKILYIHTKFTILS